MKVSKEKVNEQGGGNAGEDDTSEEDEPDHIVKLSKGGEHKGKYLVRWKGVNKEGDAWPDSHKPRSYFTGVPKREEMLAQYEHGEADQKKRKHSEAEVRRQKQVHQQNGEYNAGDYVYDSTKLSSTRSTRRKGRSPSD